MSYDPNYPADNLMIADIPAAIRAIARQIITEEIVNAGQLGGYTATDFALKSNMLNIAVNPPFVVSGNFIVPEDVTTVYVSICGAGGGGSTLWGCGGGAGQSIYRKAVSGLTPGQVIPITIGSGGLAGYNFASCSYTVSAIQSLCATYNVSGSNGGDSSFGTYVIAKGGKGAAVTQSTANPGLSGGPGGLPGGLICAMQGATKIRNGGDGGSSLFGVGGMGGIYPYAGVSVGALRDGTDGIGYGSGGAGGGDYTDGSTLWVTGAGDGTSGICIVEW